MGGVQVIAVVRLRKVNPKNSIPAIPPPDAIQRSTSPIDGRLGF